MVYRPLSINTTILWERSFDATTRKTTSQCTYFVLWFNNAFISWRLQGITKTVLRFPTVKRRMVGLISYLSEELDKKNGSQSTSRSRSGFLRLISQKSFLSRTSSRGGDQETQLVTQNGSEIAWLKPSVVLSYLFFFLRYNVLFKVRNGCMLEWNNNSIELKRLLEWSNSSIELQRLLQESFSIFQCANPPICTIHIKCIYW